MKKLIFTLATALFLSQAQAAYQCTIAKADKNDPRSIKISALTVVNDTDKEVKLEGALENLKVSVEGFKAINSYSMKIEFSSDSAITSIGNFVQDYALTLNVKDKNEIITLTCYKQ
jgi:hypothetical protein